MNELLKISQEVMSYDQLISEQGEGAWFNAIVDQSESIQNEIDLERLRECLFQNLQMFEETYRQIIIKRFGLDGKEPKTLEEISKDLNISKERIRQILAQCLSKIKMIFEQTFDELYVIP